MQIILSDEEIRTIQQSLESRIYVLVKAIHKQKNPAAESRKTRGIKAATALAERMRSVK